MRAREEGERDDDFEEEEEDEVTRANKKRPLRIIENVFAIRGVWGGETKQEMPPRFKWRCALFFTSPVMHHMRCISGLVGIATVTALIETRHAGVKNVIEDIFICARQQSHLMALRCNMRNGAAMVPMWYRYGLFLIKLSLSFYLSLSRYLVPWCWCDTGIWILVSGLMGFRKCACSMVWGSPE